MQDEYRKAKEKKYISQETPAQAESHEYVSGKPCCRYDFGGSRCPKHQS